MPDTLFTVFLSMGYFMLLLYLPNIIWIYEGDINIVDLLKGHHRLAKRTLNSELASSAFENYKETYPIFLFLSVLGITMGIPIHTAALIWLILRLVNGFSYLYELNWIRTVSWHLSLLCLFWMSIEIIRLNRLTMFTHF